MNVNFPFITDIEDLDNGKDLLNDTLENEHDQKLDNNTSLETMNESIVLLDATLDVKDKEAGIGNLILPTVTGTGTVRVGMESHTLPLTRTHQIIAAR